MSKLETIQRSLKLRLMDIKMDCKVWAKELPKTLVLSDTDHSKITESLCELRTRYITEAKEAIEMLEKTIHERSM
jgi:hypothetical protein